MNKRALIIYCVLTFIIIQLQGCSTMCCGTADTYDLCEQILREPDLLPIISKDREIRCELFGTGAYMSDAVRFIKQHFSPECIERGGCNYYAEDTRIQYEYYGGDYVYPSFHHVEKAYLRFVFRKVDSHWVLVLIQNIPIQKYPYHDSDWDGQRRK